MHYLNDNTPLLIQTISHRHLPCYSVALEAVACQLSAQASALREAKGTSLKQRV